MPGRTRRKFDRITNVAYGDPRTGAIFIDVLQLQQELLDDRRAWPPSRVGAAALRSFRRCGIGGLLIARLRGGLGEQ